MTRNLKAMGLALLGVFALGAVGAQGAGAVVEHTFTSDANGGTVLTATTEPGTKEAFTLTGAKIECTDVTYRGFLSNNASDHTSVVPIFGDSHCTAFPGNLAATIHNNGCTHTFDSDTFENVGHFAAGVEHANVSLECNHGGSDTGSISITIGGCIIEVGTTHSGVKVNHNLPGVHYTELPSHSGGKTGMTVEATVKTIKALSTGANCTLIGLGSNGTHSNGVYSAKGIITGYEGNSYEPHTQSPTEGALRNIGLSTP